jgi:glycine cleavage system H protein
VPSPVDGEIVEVNEALAGEPTLVNSDPYGAGWIARLRAVDWPGQSAALASGEAGLADYVAFLDANGIRCG